MSEQDDRAISVREFDARLQEVRRAVDLAAGTAQGVDLREYVDRLFIESQRATEMAERGRAAAAIALRESEQRATEMAEREREKAAEALREGLARLVAEGDDRLREHIANQVQQILAALTSAEKLEIERFSSAKEGRAALEEKLAVIQAASSDAIAKAENANERRFESVNEFRSQLTDQTAAFLRREVADAQFTEIRRSVAELAEKVGKLV